MKLLLVAFIFLLLCPSETRAKTGVDYILSGLGYSLESFVYDLATPTPPTPQQAFMTYAEVIRAAGYHFEEHKITTNDGYINTALRIYK